MYIYTLINAMYTCFLSIHSSIYPLSQATFTSDSVIMSAEHDGQVRCHVTPFLYTFSCPCMHYLLHFFFPLFLLPHASYSYTSLYSLLYSFHSFSSSSYFFFSPTTPPLPPFQFYFSSYNFQLRILRVMVKMAKGFQRRCTGH